MYTTNVYLIIKVPIRPALITIAMATTWQYDTLLLLETEQKLTLLSLLVLRI